MNSLNTLAVAIFGDRNYGVTKIKNTEFESVYACECKSMLRKDKNYLFIIGTKDIISIGANVRMEDISNISCIQFRTFQEPILQKVLSNKIELETVLSSVPIKRYNISKDEIGNKVSEYLFEYNGKPYNVHIFHTTDSDFEYVPDGNLYSAIITWNTMVINSVDIVSRQAPPLQTQEQLSDPYQFHKQPRTGIRPRQNQPNRSSMRPPSQLENLQSYSQQPPPQQQSYSQQPPPQQQSYRPPPPQQTYRPPPPQQTYRQPVPPQQQTYRPPPTPQQTYRPPSTPQINKTHISPQQTYRPPVPLQQTYRPPSTPKQSPRYSQYQQNIFAQPPPT